MSLMPEFAADLERVADGWHRPRARVARAARPVLATLLACAALAAVLLAAGPAQQERAVAPPAAPDPVAPQPPVGEIDPRLRERFAVFAAPATERDVPEPYADFEGKLPFGMDPAIARRVGPDTFAKLYAIPAADSLCLLVDEQPGGHGVGCGSLARRLEEGSMSSSAAPGKNTDRLVHGLVPDWVTEVRMFPPDGPPVTTTPVRNAFSIVVPEKTYSGELRAGDTAVSVSVPNP